MKPPGRRTNLALLAALGTAFATGAGATATGSACGEWVVIAHGLAGMLVVVLVPWKTSIARRGLRRPGPSRWWSLSLGVLAVLTLVTGILYATGLARSIAGTRGMWLHVALALAVLPLIIWHVTARRTRVRRTDLSRRTALRTGLLGAGAAGLYFGTAGLVSLAALPGAKRRFTGSYEVASFTPAAMPATIWLDDTSPAIDPASWTLTVVDAAGTFTLTLDDLRSRAQTRRATLDCTSGWYSTQDWTGVPLTDLIRDTGNARSVHVRSTTGYWVRLPIGDLGTLLLATGAAGRPLRRGHGFPARLVAPGRRGFWWVKWVDRIELQATPWWVQSPFPLT